MNRKRIFQGLFWLWFTAVWVLSMIPLSVPDVPSGDKVGHFVSYGLLAWLAGNLEPNRLRVWLGASLMGVVVECVQYLLPWRSFELLDMLANSTGALLGIFLLILIRRLFRVPPAL